MKKFLLVAVATISLFVGVLLVLPFFYSIDSLRPELQAQAERSLNAKVSIGKIRLSLFPQVLVSLDDIQVVPTAKEYSQKELLNLSSLQLKMPLYALLFAPKLSLVIDGAKIVLVQTGENSNLNSVLLPTEQTPPAQTESTPSGAEAQASPAVGEMLDSLPPFIAKPIRNARIDFSILGSQLSIENTLAAKTEKTEIQNLNLSLKDIGLATPIELLLTLDAQVAKEGAKISGPVKIFGTVEYSPEGQNQKISLNITKDISGLDIQVSPLFHKKSGTPFLAQAEGVILQGPKTADLSFNKLVLKFANVDLSGNLQSQVPISNPLEGTFDFGFKIDDFQIGAWGALIPMVAEYALGGKVNANFSAKGKFSDPAINLESNFSEVTGSTPQLKTPITQLQGKLVVEGKVSQPQVRLKPFSMNIGKSDLKVEVESRGINQIGLNVAVSSNKIDADEILDLKPLNLEESAAADVASAGAQSSQEKGAALAPVLPLDQALTDMAPLVEERLKNPALDTLTANFKLDIKTLKALGADFKNIKTDIVYKDRILSMRKTGLQAYNGQLSAEMTLNLKKPESLGFQFSTDLTNVDFYALLSAHAPSWKKDFSGTLNGKFEAKGNGLRKDQLEKSLAGGLNGEMRSGRLSLPVEKVINLAFEELPKLKILNNQIPEQNKKQQAKGEFKVCKMVTSFQGRKVNIGTMDITYDTKGGGLGEFEFKSSGQIDFDQNVAITGVALMSPEVIRIPELKGPSGKIEIPLKIGGTLAVPETDIPYTLKILGERYAQNYLKSKVINEAKAKAQEQVKQAAETAVKKAAEEAAKKAPEPIKKELEKLKSKFKF